MNKEVLSPAALTGLSDGEAQDRLGREGYNELPQTERRTGFRIVLEVLRGPMLALLLAGAISNCLTRRMRTKPLVTAPLSSMPFRSSTLRGGYKDVHFL